MLNIIKIDKWEDNERIFIKTDGIIDICPQKMSLPNQEFVCDVCKHSFPTKKGLGMHKKVHKV